MHTYFLFIIFDIIDVAWEFSDYFFFLSLPFYLCWSCLWHLNINPLQPGTPFKEFLKNFSRRGFIRNAKSFCRTLLTPTFPLSFTVGDGSHYVMSRSPVLSCLSRSFTLTCTRLIVYYLSSSLVFEVCAFLSQPNLLRMCFRSLG